jgi:hypothetical protein
LSQLHPKFISTTVVRNGQTHKLDKDPLLSKLRTIWRDGDHEYQKYCRAAEDWYNEYKKDLGFDQASGQDSDEDGMKYTHTNYRNKYTMVSFLARIAWQYSIIELKCPHKCT